MIQTGNWSQQVNDTNAITRIGTFFLAWGSHAHAEVKVSVLEFSNLSNWTAICAVGQHTTDADTFFEAFFKPIKIETTDPSLLTGYFEPELQVSRTKTGKDAGRIKNSGSLYVLLPIKRALALSRG